MTISLYFCVSLTLGDCKGAPPRPVSSQQRVVQPEVCLYMLNILLLLKSFGTGRLIRDNFFPYLIICIISSCEVMQGPCRLRGACSFISFSQEEATVLMTEASPIPSSVCVATVAEREEVRAPPSDQPLVDTRKVCTFYK